MKPQMVRVYVDLPDEMIAEIDRIAKEDGITRNDVIVRAIGEYLESRRPIAHPNPLKDYK